MSHNNKQPVASTKHRSSPIRSGSYNSRPRSLGYYGASTAPYSSLYSNTSNPYSSINNYNSYSSNYQSPYFPNGYRGGTGAIGYASLKIPAKSLSNINVVTPSYSKTYDNNREYVKSDTEHVSRRDASKANNTYTRNRSLSRSRNPLPSSGMGSRSTSLTSLNSEGYVSGTERNNTSNKKQQRSRLSSTSDIRNEYGEIDYKKLYKQQLAENERLKEKLRKSEEELRETKEALEKMNVFTRKNSISELERRERRAMERKLSEMEEELKQLQKLKAENERLKADNRSLTRVINKLTNSTKK